MFVKIRIFVLIVIICKANCDNYHPSKFFLNYVFLKIFLFFKLFTYRSGDSIKTSGFQLNLSRIADEFYIKIYSATDVLNIVVDGVHNKF